MILEALWYWSKSKENRALIHKSNTSGVESRILSKSFFIRLMNVPFLDIFCLEKNKVFQKHENLPFLWQSCFLERNNKIHQREPMHLIDETKAYKR